MRILQHTSKRLLGSKFLRRSLSVAVLALADGISLIAGLWGAARFSGGDMVLNLAPLLLAAWIPLFAAFRLYDRAPVRRNPGALVGSAFCWAGLVAIVAAVYPGAGLGLGEILPAAFLALLCAATLRFLYERTISRVYRRGFGQTPVLVVGSEEDRAGVRKMMEDAPGRLRPGGRGGPGRRGDRNAPGGAAGDARPHRSPRGRPRRGREPA